jgi:hypothetical protein
MGLILRVPHYPLPSGATVSSTKLTLQQMDENFIFLQNLISGLTPLTVEEAVDLKNNSQIVIGQSYLITDADPSLYGTQSAFVFGDGTNIILQGIDVNSFSSNGYGKFYNPNYASYSVWDDRLSYNTNDKVIYGGRVWNKTGNSGHSGSLDYLSLDEDWTTLSYTNTNYYNVVWDEIEYDFNNNFICSRYDALNNNLVKNNYDVQFFNCEMWPIQGFRWGHNINDGGVTNCNIINSYFGCLNYVSGQIYNINYTNFCVSYNINLYSNSKIDNINLQDYCSLSNFTICGGSIYNIKMENDSSINGFSLNGDDIEINNNSCYISNISLINNSSIYDFSLNPNNLDSETYLTNISLSNGSSINGFDLYSYDYTSTSTSLENIIIDNNCSIYDFSLTADNNYCSSYLYDISLTNTAEMSNFSLYAGSTSSSSYFEDIVISNDSYITSIEAYQTYFANFNISTDSFFGGGLYAENTQFSYITLNNYSYIIGDYETDDNITGDGSINFYGSTFRNISLSNNSIFTGLFSASSSSISNLKIDYGYFGGRDQDSEDLFSNSMVNSTIDNLLIERYSWISNLEMHYSNIYNSKISNYSRISSDGGTNSSILLNGSTLNYINLNNHSYIGYDRIELNNSNWYDVTLENDSKIGGYISFSASQFGVISLNNNSKFWGDNDDIIIENSNIHYVNMDNRSEVNGYMEIIDSNVQQIEINGGFWGGFNNDFYLNSSTFSWISILNGSSIVADYDPIYIQNGSTMQYINLTNNSYIDGYLNLNTGATIEYLDLTNESHFGDNNNINIYQNSIVSNVKISNNSYIQGYIDLGEGSIFKNINVDNNSYIAGSLYIYAEGTASYENGSEFSNINITNNSYISGTINLGYNNTNGYGIIKDITINNGSYLGDGSLTVANMASMQYITIENFSRISGNIYLSDANTKFYYVDVKNYSYIHPNSINLHNASEIKYITLDNHSHIVGNLEMNQASKIKRVQMANYSKISSVSGGNYLYNGSEIQYMSMINVSDNSGTSCYGPGFDSFYLDSSSLHGLNMEWSTLGGLHMSNGATAQGLTIENSSVLNVSITDNSGFYNSKIYNSYVDGDIIGSIWVDGGSKLENLIIDTTDFPTWNSNYYGLYIGNESVVRNMTLKNMALIDRINIRNTNSSSDGLLHNFNVDDSFVEYFYAENGQFGGYPPAYVKDVVITNSYVSIFNTINSEIQNLNLDNGSSIINFNINGSYLDNLNLNDSYLNTLNVVNYSSIDTISLTNSSNIAATNLNLGNLSNLNMEDSSLFNFNLNGAKIHQYNPIGINQINCNLTNIDFNYASATNSVLTETLAHGNTIKYQFTVDLTDVNGTINIPTVLIPSSGWYFEKVLLDSTTLVSSGTSSISMGMTSHLECVFNDIDLMTLSDTIKVYDLSTFATPGAKSSGIEKLVMFTGYDAVVSGTISIEVTFKNTTYSADWFL